MQVDVIRSNLLVGSCPRSRGDVDQLKSDFGVTAVLNLQTDADLQYTGIDWQDLASYYEVQGIAVRRVPVVDFDPGSLRDNLPRCVAQLDELLRAGRTVYVHCNAGINRSPSATIAYLHWVERQELGEAVWMVTSLHACDPYVTAIVQATPAWDAIRAREDEPPSI